jgi:hypothetical protein
VQQAGWTASVRGYESLHDVLLIDLGPQLPACSTTSNTLPSQLFSDLHSLRIKTSYGPFAAPPQSNHHGMRDFSCAAPLPCNDCTILFMHAGLEYLDGSEAVIETGMSLHHVVFQNFKRKDPMCSKRRRERFFASGDERTPIDLTSGG